MRQAWVQRVAGASLAVALAGFVVLPVVGQETRSCADRLKLRVSSGGVTQGSLVLVDVESPEPPSRLDAQVFDRRIYFWRESKSKHSYRAMVGVDLESPPGVFPLIVNAAWKDGARVACSLLGRVEEGEFAVERLQVARKFVELSPEDLERARRESERLQALFARVTPQRLWRGPFEPPLKGAASSENFGRRRILNGEPRSPHSGEDYPAPAGTAVRAPARGRVAFAAHLFFSGYTVVLDHGLGLYTFYGHLQSIAVKEGQMVEAAEGLGRVGATGRVTGAHLHWAVRLNRARVNPRDLLQLFSE